VKYEDRANAKWPDNMWPMCFVCQKPVAEMMYYVNDKTGEQMFRAGCHGQEELVAIDRMDLELGAKLVAHVAFRKALLNN